MNLTSTAFEHGSSIPSKFTGEGANVSPELQWDDVPPETKQFVLTYVDLDAPGPQPWIHWLIYEIPGTERSLPEGVPDGKSLTSPAGALQGRNSFSIGNLHGFQGPMPHATTGVHHYLFTLYALDNQLDLESGLQMRTVISAMDGHILAQAELMGTYER